jgi:ectoine hydroxylase-related dioxygenase (phytanoyl-CoA dioxygenase family)
MTIIALDRLVPDTKSCCEHLEAEGYCIVRNAVPSSLVDRLASDLAQDFAATPHSVGPFYGETTRRFHGLLRRSRQMGRFALDPLVVAVVERFLQPWCDTIQLNLTQAIEIEPGGVAQPPHRDQDMWPVHTAGVEYMINVMWPFSAYRAENGATLIWPGSHRRQDEIVMPAKDAVAAEMDPGDALIFLGSTLHAGGANKSANSRRGMIISYSLGWLKPYELPWLAYPPEIARSLPRPLMTLAGYQAHRPNLGTYEGRCPSLLLNAIGDGKQGAVDVLRPEQERLIADYRAGRILPDFAGSPPEDG